MTQKIWTAYLEGVDGEYSVSVHATETGADAALKQMILHYWESEIEDDDEIDLETATVNELAEWVGDQSYSAHVEEHEVKP